MKKFLLLVVVLALIWIGYRWRTTAPAEPVVTETTLPPVVMSDSRTAETVTKTESENIRVTSPTPNATVHSPFLVSGEARVFENMFRVRVKNAQGETLIEENAYAHAKDAGEFGPFSVNLSYQFQNTKEGFVEVFSQSAKDGSEENLVRIPVRFE